MKEVSSSKQFTVTIPPGHGGCREAALDVVIDDP